MTAGITFPYENPLVPSDATLRGVLAGLTTMQIGAPGTQPSVPPGGYAERRAREMEILNAAISRLRPEENPCAALRVALAGLTTMHVGAPGTRPTVPPGGYAERRARELEAIHAAVSSHAPEDRSGAALRAALAGLTTTQVGAPNTRPVVPPGGYAERRAAEMEAIDAAMFDSGRR
jgi:hypothetical protein